MSNQNLFDLLERKFKLISGSRVFGYVALSESNLKMIKSLYPNEIVFYEELEKK